MKKTLFDKIVVGFVFLVIIIFTVLVFFTIRNTDKNILENTASRLRNESVLIANTTIADYLYNDLSDLALKDELDSAAETLNCYIWFSDREGNLIVISENYTEKRLPVNIAECVSKGTEYTFFTEIGTFGNTFSNDVLSIGIPVYKNNSYAGLLTLHTSLSFQDAIMRNTFTSIYTPFLAMMILALIALMGITNSMLKPMRKIIATSQSYAAGNFNARVNITSKNEFGELAKSMEQMADELSRSNEYRRTFISNISHDFRSPLTSIKGYIEAMLDGTIPPDNYEKYLTIVLNETKRLTKLTQGLLELNNYDSFDLQLDRSNFDLKQIITPTMNTFEGRCQDRGIYLHCIFHTENTTVYADRTKIQQVIYNLVDNAIKFTPEGRQITIQVTEKNDKIYTSVKDEGVGIPKESIKKVFDRFYKTDPSRGKDKTGTGLGLAITKEIIKAHGEQITLESEVNEGSEFIFSLPKQKEMQVPIKPVHVKRPEAQNVSNGKFRIKKDD